MAPAFGLPVWLHIIKASLLRQGLEAGMLSRQEVVLIAQSATLATLLP